MLGVMEEVESIFVREIEAMGPVRRIDGVETLTEMIAASDNPQATQVFKEFESQHPEVAETLRGRLKKNQEP